MALTPTCSSSSSALPMENNRPVLCDIHYLGPTQILSGRTIEIGKYSMTLGSVYSYGIAGPRILSIAPLLEGRFITPLSSEERERLGLLCLGLNEIMKCSSPGSQPIKTLTSECDRGTCVIGSQSPQFNLFPTPHAPGLFRCHVLDDQLDMSQLPLHTIYYKSESGKVTKILVDELNLLLSFFGNSNASQVSSSSDTTQGPDPRIVELCYKLLGERDNISAFEQIKRENQDLITSSLLPIGAITERCRYEMLSKYGINPGWRSIYDSLEQCSEALGWESPDKTLAIHPFERSETPFAPQPEDFQVENHPYKKASDYLLAVASLKKFKTLFMLLDSKSSSVEYRKNPALLPLSLLTPFAIQPDETTGSTISQILASENNPFKLIKDSYAIALQKGELAQWFADAFQRVPGDCFSTFLENVLNAHAVLTDGGYAFTPLEKTQNRALEALALPLATIIDARLRTCVPVRILEEIVRGVELSPIERKMNRAMRLRSFLTRLKEDPRIPNIPEMDLSLLNREGITSELRISLELFSFMENLKREIIAFSLTHSETLFGVRNSDLSESSKLRQSIDNLSHLRIPGSLADLYLHCLEQHIENPNQEVSLGLRSFFEYLPHEIQDWIRFSFSKMARESIPSYFLPEYIYESNRLFIHGIDSYIRNCYQSKDALFKEQVQESILEMQKESVIAAFNALPEELKNRVYQQIWYACGNPMENDPYFGQNHVFDDWVELKAAFERIANQDTRRLDTVPLEDHTTALTHFYCNFILTTPELFAPPGSVAALNFELAPSNLQRLAVAISQVEARRAREGSSTPSSST